MPTQDYLFSIGSHQNQNLFFFSPKPDITIAFPSLSANSNAFNRTEVFVFTRRCFSPDFKICNSAFEKEQFLFSHLIYLTYTISY